MFKSSFIANRWFLLSLRCAALIFLLFGCEAKKAASSKEGSPVGTSTSTGAITKTFVSKIMERYCQDVWNVKLRADITAELDYFCKNKAPTPSMIDLVKAIQESSDGRAPLKIVSAKHDEDQWSEFWIVWGFRAPTAPIALKDRPIYDLIAKGTTTPNLQLKASATRQPDETVDHALHIWSAALNYDLTILGSNNLRIPTKRSTQYNLYQLRPTVEDMGLGVEHLMDTDNEDYRTATMINISFTNEAPGSTGSVNLALSHIKIYNRGFSNTAETAMREISEFLADTMFKTLQ